MSSNRTKYSEEMREQTTIFILESGKSATSVAEEMGIDVNTVCRWVRDYRRKHKRSLRDMNEQYKSQYSMILYKNYIDIFTIHRKTKRFNAWLNNNSNQKEKIESYLTETCPSYTQKY